MRAQFRFTMSGSDWVCQSTMFQCVTQERLCRLLQQRPLVHEFGVTLNHQLAGGRLAKTRLHPTADLVVWFLITDVRSESTAARFQERIRILQHSRTVSCEQGKQSETQTHCGGDFARTSQQ